MELEDLARGMKQAITYDRLMINNSGRLTLGKQTLELSIPAGFIPLSSGPSFTVPGRGHYREDKGRCDDLKIYIKHATHPEFEVLDDGDGNWVLKRTITIDLVESLCGWERTLKDIYGRRFMISSPTGKPSPHGRMLTCEGRGFPMGEGKEKGDLLVEICVTWPSQVDSRQRELVRRAFMGEGGGDKKDAPSPKGKGPYMGDW